MPYRRPHPPLRKLPATAKAVGDCKPVASLRDRACALAALDLRLRRTLPEPLQDQVRLADLRDGRIVFLAPTPAMAARLRTCRDDLLATAHVLGAQADTVVVKVAPIPTDTYQPARAKPLPGAAADHLRKAAQSLSDHELKALFLNLASLADGTSSTREPR
jgi:hypothetical protein